MSYTGTSPLQFEDQALYLVEGMLSELQTARTTVNLLEQIDGTFQHADKIQEGDRVKAVVSKRGDVLFAHSIMNAKTQEFYIPMNVFSSSDCLDTACEWLGG